MAEHEQIEVHIRSNVDALSADRIHQALVEMVQRNVEESTEFLRVIEPKRTGALEAHTSHTDAIESIVGQIEAEAAHRKQAKLDTASQPPNHT